METPCSCGDRSSKLYECLQWLIPTLLATSRNIWWQSSFILFSTFYTRAGVQAVRSRTLHTLSVTKFLRSLKRLFHLYIAECLIVAAPYTANKIARISGFVLSYLTKNLILTLCSIIGSISIVQKNAM